MSNAINVNVISGVTTGWNELKEEMFSSRFTQKKIWVTPCDSLLWLDSRFLSGIFSFDTAILNRFPLLNFKLLLNFRKSQKRCSKWWILETEIYRIRGRRKRKNNKGDFLHGWRTSYSIALDTTKKHFDSF